MITQVHEHGEKHAMRQRWEARQLKERGRGGIWNQGRGSLKTERKKVRAPIDRRE